MILCHKDAGLLAARSTEDTTGLLGCACMSGWVRGFEPDLSRRDAIQTQITQQDGWIELYQRQGRSAAEIAQVQARRDRLAALLNGAGA